MNIKSLKAPTYAQGGKSQLGTVELQPSPRDGSAPGAQVAVSCRDPACPSCGAGDCNQHGSVNGLARYRCQHCFKIFSVSSLMRRTRRDEYERWLADIAS